MPLSWTFGLWRERGTFVNLKIFCICLEKFAWGRAAAYRLGQKLKTDEWLVTTGRRHSWTAAVVTGDLVIIWGAINLLLALVWDLVDVTHVGWCLGKEKSTSGNGQWYLKKVGLHRSCPCSQAWRKKREFFFSGIWKKNFKEVFSLMKCKGVLCPWRGLLLVYNTFQNRRLCMACLSLWVFFNWQILNVKLESDTALKKIHWKKFIALLNYVTLLEVWVIPHGYLAHCTF